jgi:predicted MPP superfamily phosphohydrolase
LTETDKQHYDMKVDAVQYIDGKEVNRRGFLKSSFITTIGIGAAGMGTYYYSRDIEPAWIDITHIQLSLPRLTAAFKGYRLVQISDLHTDDTWMTATRLAGVVQTVNALNPDLLVITGDYVTWLIPDSADTLSALSKLRAKDGVLGILGNHDHASGADLVTSIVSANNVRMLNNATYTIQRGDQMLHIVGMDDLWPANRGIPAPVWSHLSLLKSLTSSIPAEGTAILLVHEPDFADVATSVNRYALQLSGHSHGGQVQIPFVGPLRVPPLSNKYPSGLYHVGDMVLYTNRGLGMVKPQVRFNCRPEITVFELSPR